MLASFNHPNILKIRGWAMNGPFNGPRAPMIGSIGTLGANGSLVQWFSGSLVHWFIGSLAGHLSVI